MKANVGSIVNLYYDSPRPVVSTDILRTPTGRTYLVLEVRQQQRGQHVGRWHIKAVVIDKLPDNYSTIHPLYWYRRNKRKVRL